MDMVEDRSIQIKVEARVSMKDSIYVEAGQVGVCDSSSEYHSLVCVFWALEEKVLSSFCCCIIAGSAGVVSDVELSEKV